MKCLAVPGCLSIPWHAPPRPHELQGPEHELDHWHVTVLLAARPVYGGHPMWLGLIPTGRRHQQMRGRLDAHGLVSHQDLHRVSPQPRIDREATVVEPTLPLLPHLAGLLTEAEDPSEAGRFDLAAPGVAQNDRWRQIVEPPLGIGAFVGPMAPQLIILHARRRLPIDPLAIGTAGHIRIQHPTWIETPPSARFCQGCPRAIGAQRMTSGWRQGLQGQQHAGMVADDDSGAPHWAIAWRQTWTTRARC